MIIGDFDGLERVTIDGEIYLVIYETKDALLVPTGNIIVVRELDVLGGAQRIHALFIRRP